jgi:glyoxylase-like metal-dependent hydrolase (beta-lactamase superfamily II)
VSVAISRLVLGPLLNNVYLLGDEDSKDAVVIDPSFEPQRQAAEIRRRGWRLRQIWLTHGHFDHIEGVAALQALFEPAPLLGMHRRRKPGRAHRAEGELWVWVSALPPVDIQFFGGQRLAVTRKAVLSLRRCAKHPGHSPVP